MSLKVYVLTLINLDEDSDPQIGVYSNYVVAKQALIDFVAKLDKTRIQTNYRWTIAEHEINEIPR